MILVIARWISWWAVVSCFQNDDAFLSIVTNVGVTSKLEAFTTGFIQPVSSSKGVGYSSRSVELGIIFVARWSLEQSI